MVQESMPGRPLGRASTQALLEQAAALCLTEQPHQAGVGAYAEKAAEVGHSRVCLISGMLLLGEYSPRHSWVFGSS